jgi:hypothetical protein
LRALSSTLQTRCFEQRAGDTNMFAGVSLFPSCSTLAQLHLYAREDIHGRSLFRG